MKKCNKIIASLLAGVLLVSSVGVLPAEASDSDATVYVKEDFENKDFVVTNFDSTTGVISDIKKYTSGGVVQHNGVTAGKIEAEVVTENDGNNVLKIDEQPNSAWNRNIYFSHGLESNPTSGTYVFQASFKNAETPFTQIILKYEASNKTAQTLFEIKSGKFNISENTLNADSWTTVRVVVTVKSSAAPYEIYINDDLVKSGTNDSFTNLKWFRLDIQKDSATSDGLGSILVDNVALYKADTPVKDAFAEPTAISLDQEAVSLNLLDSTNTVALTPTITTAGFQPDVTWSSDNEDVATVDENGTVTAVATGTAKISATIATTSGNLSAECTVSVRDKKIYITENFENNDFEVINFDSTSGVTSNIKTYTSVDGGVVQHNGVTAGKIEAKVVTENDGNKVLKIDEQLTPAWNRNIFFSHGLKSDPTTGTYVFEASFKSTETPFTKIILKYEKDSKDAETLYEINSGEFSIDNTYKLDTNSWTTVRVVATLQDSTYDIYINDTHVKRGTSSRFASFKSFRLDMIKDETTDGLGSILVDNVALYQVADANTVLEDIFYTTVDGTNLTLDDGNIGIKYHVNTDNLLPNKTDKMKFTLDGKVAYVENTEGDYIFEYGVPAKMMTETITAQLVDANGKALMYPVEYTIRDNALAIIEGSTKEPDDVLTQDMIDEYEKATPLATAMLNYGAYAQIHFDYNTDALANAGVETDITSVTADSLSAYTGSDYVSVTGDTSIGSLVGTVVTLESNTYLKYYFLLDSNLSVEDLTFTDGDDNSLKATTNNGYCEVVIEGIKATNLNTPYTVNVTDGEHTLSATYCVMTNIYNVLAASEGTYEESHVNVCKALYLYNVAADKYFTAIAE